MVKGFYWPGETLVWSRADQPNHNLARICCTEPLYKLGMDRYECTAAIDVFTSTANDACASEGTFVACKRDTESHLKRCVQRQPCQVFKIRQKRTSSHIMYGLFVPSALITQPSRRAARFERPDVCYPNGRATNTGSTLCRKHTQTLQPVMRGRPHK